MSRTMVIGAWCALVVASVLAVIWALQRGLMYFPDPDVPPPGALGLVDVDPVAFETADGLRLNGWFFRSPVSPPVTVLIFNGNAGNRSHRAPLAAALCREGMQVLLVDYRGYGENPGRPSKDGLRADARAARDHVARRSDVDPSRIVYFGESLGTAVAVDLAMGYPPAAMILRSPFTSIADVGQHHYPLLPVRLLLRDRFAPIDQIRRIHAPLLVIAGGEDRVIPLESSRQLYEAAPEPKTFLLLEHADHNDYELLTGREMIQAIVRFLQPLSGGEDQRIRS